MGSCLVNLDYLPIPVPEETLEERVARRAGTAFAHFLVWVFSPSPPGRPSGSPGVGFFPLLVLRVRLELAYLRLPRHSRCGIVNGYAHLAQVALLARNSVARWG